MFAFDEDMNTGDDMTTSAPSGDMPSEAPADADAMADKPAEGGEMASEAPAEESMPAEGGDDNGSEESSEGEDAPAEGGDDSAM